MSSKWNVRPHFFEKANQEEKPELGGQIIERSVKHQSGKDPMVLQ